MTAMREALIDVSAIEQNTRQLIRMTGVDLIAVVKADGFGHGAVRSAAAAIRGGANRLAVADLTEAMELRRGGIDEPIIAWLHAPGQDFSEAAAAHIELGVSNMEQLQAAAAAASAEHAVGVHLKLETGLGRNGIPPEDYVAVFSEAARLERIGRIRVVGIFSHLSTTSPEDDRAALAAFLDGLDEAARLGIHPQIRHLAAMHAAVTLPETRLDAVRIGLGIYGLSPFEERTSRDLGLRPAMTLQAEVAAVRRVPAGHGVSYGYTYTTPRETTLALIPIGYADGAPRQASGAGPVVIGGQWFVASGRIAMDQFVVDVGDAPVKVGQTAVLFGDPTLGVPAVEEWADAASTINYDIVTRIGPRVIRREVRA